jgi:microcystin degradation protein MlrC
MRIAMGGISHETNTFCSGKTGLGGFQEREWGVGQEIIDANKGVRSYQGGVIDAAEQLGIELVPTFYASATPSAIIARDAFDEMENLLIQKLDEAGDLDGIVLNLHGAGVAEGIDDIESHVIKRVRQHFGPDMPIVVTLDLHGNIFQESLDNADALFGVNLYPHTDSYDRGVEAVEMLPEIIKGNIKPAMHITHLPMMLPSTTTDLSPAKDINEICWEWEKQDGVIDCTFFHGFAPADIPRVGVSVITMTNNDPEKAKQISEDVASTIWERREEFRPPINPPEKVFEMANEDDGRPVIINEKADNPGGGGPGDGTHLLRAMIEAQLEDACFGFIHDPETVAQAHDAGVGATISVRLGGKKEPLHGEPIEAQAYVKCLTDGKFIQQSPMGRGRKVDLGKMARLVIDGIDVIVSTIRTQTLDDEVFRLHGIEVTRYKFVAIKSSNHFRAGFSPIAHKIIRADTPGLVSADLSTFNYKRLERPIWPLDDNVTWP